MYTNIYHLCPLKLTTSQIFTQLKKIFSRIRRELSYTASMEETDLIELDLDLDLDLLVMASFSIEYAIKSFTKL